MITMMMTKTVACTSNIHESDANSREIRRTITMMIAGIILVTALLVTE